MSNKENLDDELKGISPFLLDLKKREDGRKVPPGYFDQFDANLMQKIATSDIKRPGMAKQSPEKRMWASFTKPRLLMSIAAAMVLLFSAFWFLKPTTASEQVNPLALELSADDVEAYVLENIHDFDSEQLAALPDHESLSEQPTQTEPKNPKKKRPELDLKPEDMAPLLDEMSDEELEQLL
ncbi:MAG: hypothetical protein NW218_11580 [Saprospiraceae bacterium]|nr:hypothetical protein [Saprospiraceae bacterium]